MNLIAALALWPCICQPHAWYLWRGGAHSHEYRVWRRTLDNTIGSPWNRRLLSCWLLWPLARVFPFPVAMMALRLTQGALLWALYPTESAGLLAWALVVGAVGTDFRVNTATDLILVLLALRVEGAALVVVAVMGALNRETFALAFPLLGWPVAPIIAFATTWGILAWWKRGQPLTCPQYTPGWRLVRRNLTDPIAWALLLAAYGPLLWAHGVPPALWWTLAAAMGANLYYGNLREVALMLNPVVLILPYCVLPTSATMTLLVMVGLLLLIIGLAGWYLYAELRDVIQRAEREFEENEL